MPAGRIVTGPAMSQRPGKESQRHPHPQTHCGQEDLARLSPAEAADLLMSRDSLESAGVSLLFNSVVPLNLPLQEQPSLPGPEHSELGKLKQGPQRAATACQTARPQERHLCSQHQAQAAPGPRPEAALPF